MKIFQKLINYYQVLNTTKRALKYRNKKNLIQIQNYVKTEEYYNYCYYRRKTIKIIGLIVFDGFTKFVIS